MAKSHCDLVLSHVVDDVELAGSLLGDRLIGYLLQLGVELLEEIFKQQRQ